MEELLLSLFQCIGIVPEEADRKKILRVVYEEARRPVQEMDAVDSIRVAYIVVWQ